MGLGLWVLLCPIRAGLGWALRVLRRSLRAGGVLVVLRPGVVRGGGARVGGIRQRSWRRGCLCWLGLVWLPWLGLVCLRLRRRLWQRQALRRRVGPRLCGVPVVGSGGVGEWLRLLSGEHWGLLGAAGPVVLGWLSGVLLPREGAFGGHERALHQWAGGGLVRAGGRRHWRWFDEWVNRA